MTFKLDDTPIDSDRSDLTSLFAEMLKFHQENPSHQFMCADDPGLNYVPQRVPRIGWVAYRTHPDPGSMQNFDEQMNTWSITLVNVRKSIPQMSERWQQYIKYALGRKELLKAVLAGEFNV